MKDLYLVPRKYHELLLVILFLLLCCLLGFIETYDCYLSVVFKDDNKYKTVISYDKKNIFKESYILYEGEKYKIWNIEYGDLIYENDNYYYEVTFELDKELDDINEVRVINNKQRIITKIKKILVGE